MRNMPLPDGRTEFGLSETGFEEVRSVPSSRRNTTISIALPSSILNNAQSPELRMYLAGQVARTAAIFCIDEVVIFDEQPDDEGRSTNHRQRNQEKPLPSATDFFTLVLEFLATPQYLRRHLFPVSQELRLVGLLNPLALPSHVARDETPKWREGVPVPRSSQSRGQARQPSDGPPGSKFIDVGRDRLVEVDRPAAMGQRITVDMSPSGPKYDSCPGKYLFGKLVPRNAPRKVDGIYWGYQVRSAGSLSQIFSNSVVAPQGYDLTIGTSERGTPIMKDGELTNSFALPDFSNLIIVFGGVQGLERSVRGDKTLEELGINADPANGDNNVGDLFDFYVNICPEQGSRTIRTEEAIPISLAALQPFLYPKESR